MRNSRLLFPSSLIVLSALGIACSEHSREPTGPEERGRPLLGLSLRQAGSDTSLQLIAQTAAEALSGAPTADSGVRSQRQVTGGTVASVKVSPSSATLWPGGTRRLRAVALNARGDTIIGRTFTWTTSSSAVARVSSTGLVTAVAVGRATIRATTGGKSGTSAITVAAVPVATVTVTPSSVTLTVRETAQLTATLKDANGNTLTGRTITWTSSAPGVVTVSSSGLVSAVGAGSATVTATSEGKSGSARATVSSVPVASVTVNPTSATLNEGETVQLTATPRDADGNPLAGRAVAWETNNSAAATVSATGLVTGAAAGTATITATSEGTSGISAITVTTPGVASVSVTPTNPGIVVGGEVQLTATPRDASGNSLSGRTVTWESDNTAVATVSSSGLVTGVGVGSATITATSDGASGTATVNVTEVPVATVTVTPASSSVTANGIVQLTATLKDANGNPLSGRDVAWRSSNTAVATVSAAGEVSGVASGRATITATSEGKSGSATVTVVDNVIQPGESIQAAVNAHPPGTTFFIRAGVHRRQNVIPKSGNTFLGDPGAILDGENAATYAFHKGTVAPAPSDVRIKGLVIERYKPPSSHGAVTAGDAPLTTGWIVEDCEIRNNSTGGVRLGNKMKVLRSFIHHNGRLGILGGLGDSILIQGNEISYNNPDKAFVVANGAGGMKLAKTRWLIVRDNWAHHNQGTGIWVDIDNISTLVEDNRAEDNSHQGIFIEISYEAVLRNNTVRRNGAAAGWLYGAGILIGHSPNVEVYGNTVADNKHGIMGIQQNRGSGMYGPYLLENLHVHDNTITVTSGYTGVGEDVGDPAVFTSRNNRFQNNTYTLGTNAKPFQWENLARSKEEWQAFGHDATGVFDP